MHNHSEHDLIQ